MPRMCRQPWRLLMLVSMSVAIGLGGQEAVGAVPSSSPQAGSSAGAVAPDGSVSARGAGSATAAAEPIVINCTWTYGIYTATYQTAYGDSNITWGGEQVCTPAIEMTASADLSYEDGTLWAQTGSFGGFGSERRVIPSDHVPEGVWSTVFHTQDLAPPGYVWVAPVPADCTGAGTPTRVCNHVAVQQLVPPS
jgi:hypothetical protein